MIDDPDELVARASQDLETLQIVSEQEPIGIGALSNQTEYSRNQIQCTLQRLEENKFIKPSSQGAVTTDMVTNSDFEKDKRIDKIIDKIIEKNIGWISEEESSTRNRWAAASSTVDDSTRLLEDTDEINNSESENKTVGVNETRVYRGNSSDSIED